MTFLGLRLFAKELKQFELFGYVIIPDHVHLMFQPKGKFNYSQIMHNVKRVFSLHANQIMFSAPSNDTTPAGDDIYHRLLWSEVLTNLHERFIAKHGCDHNLPKFKWQSSFRDHIIRNEEDYLNHLDYIYNNGLKHGLVKDPEQYPWMWTMGMKHPFAPD